MTIISMGFTTMNVQRKSTKPGKMEINNNVSVKDVDVINLNIGSEKEKALRFEFEYSTKYNPDIAEIILHGDVVYATDEKTAKDTADYWKKKKDVQNPVIKEVLNAVLARCSVQALMLSRELNLPPPIPMPKIE